MPESEKKSAAKSVAALGFEIAFFEGIVRRDPDYVEALKILGDAYTKRGHYEKGLRIDERLAKLCPADNNVHYNLACSLALTDKLDEALDTLERAVAHGYSDAKWMLKDTDLEKLCDHPRFKKLVKKISSSRE